MKRIENECVGCTSIGLYCLGSRCPNINVERYYCDICGCEIEDTYGKEYGEELCDECFREVYGS